MTEWRWISEALILAIHDEQLAEHGGGLGVRDMSLLQSALTRPLNRAAYSEVDLFDLAACYAFGIVRNHPFVDGNKRTGLVAAALFLLDNGWEIETSDEATVTTMLRLSEGSMSEEEYAAWLRSNSIPTDATD